MRIARVRIATYSIPLDPPWPSSQGLVSRREGAILFLEEEDGALGYGETAPWPGFGLETFPSSLAALRLAAKYLVGLPRERYRAAIQDLHRLAPVVASPCARHAIDLALHHLLAQDDGVSLAKLLGGAAALERVPVSRAIPRLPAKSTAAAASSAVSEGYRTIKLKVGGVPPLEDVERVREARAAVGPSIGIRIDANQAWSEAVAVEALRLMQDLDLEFCEQPVRAGDVAAMARVRARSGARIAADESVHDLPSARRLLEQDAADVLIVKPMALGGLFPARAVAAHAQEFGADVVVTSLLDGPVGRIGALNLAASLGRSRWAHGVGTPLSTLEDIALTRGSLGISPLAPLSPAIWHEYHGVQDVEVAADSEEEHP